METCDRIVTLYWRKKKVLSMGWSVWWTIILLLLDEVMPEKFSPDDRKLHPILFEHEPESFTPTRSVQIKGTDYTIPPSEMTPDFRDPQPPYLAKKPAKEFDRPFKLSPYNAIDYQWRNLVSCACVTVYKRLTPLAGCAVLTTRHILTTATSIELVLKGRRDYKRLEQIYGAWYDTNVSGNSTLYAAPARIHYHPMYVSPESVNASHPVPCVFDLAVWAATHRFYWSLVSAVSVCKRGGPNWIVPPRPFPDEQSIVVGWQFIYGIRRKPMPWYRYGVRTRKNYYPCPKTEWGGFYCLSGQWALLGLDSGAPQFRFDHYDAKQNGKVYDGLIGMNAFSMRLRSKVIVHYFTILNTHKVLDFIYDAYNGRLPYAWLDNRFFNTIGKAPIPKPWFFIPFKFEFGKTFEHITYS